MDGRRLGQAEGAARPPRRSASIRAIPASTASGVRPAVGIDGRQPRGSRLAGRSSGQACAATLGLQLSVAGAQTGGDAPAEQLGEQVRAGVGRRGRWLADRRVRDRRRRRRRCRSRPARAPVPPAAVRRRVAGSSAISSASGAAAACACAAAPAPRPRPASSRPCRGCRASRNRCPDTALRASASRNRRAPAGRCAARARCDTSRGPAAPRPAPRRAAETCSRSRADPRSVAGAARASAPLRGLGRLGGLGLGGHRLLAPAWPRALAGRVCRAAWL